MKRFLVENAFRLSGKPVLGSTRDVHMYLDAIKKVTRKPKRRSITRPKLLSTTFLKQGTNKR